MTDTSLAQDYRKADWALVTGASDGIGRALAVEAAKAGYNVILTGRRLDRLEAHAESLRRAYYVATICMTADLADPETAEALWTEAVKDRRIAVLVNNAGLGRNGAFSDPDGWPRETESIMVNVIAATILLKRAVAHMASNGGGRVLNVASVAGFMPGPNMAVYHATKAYMLSLSEAVAAEAAGAAVYVTALCPGATQTGFFAADNAERATALTRLMPLPSADRVAAAGWKAMERGQRIVVTGWMNKVFAFAPRLLPRRLQAFVTRQVLKRRW
jgi:short-subunit dehydrogenase